jgi:hypothetical protein
MGWMQYTSRIIGDIVLPTVVLAMVPIFLNATRLSEWNSVIVKYGFCDPLRGLQGRSVSNTVSNAEKFEHSPANLSGQKVLRFGEIWTSKSTGEQEIWA